jgi:5,10-methylenetetrahydromethanopterin reductase
VSCVLALQKAALDLGVTSSTPMSQLVKMCALAEHTDIQGIWIGEDLRSGVDVFVQASIVMLNAPTKNVGIGVTSPLVRNVTTISRAAAALQQMDSTRFRLGVGVGGLQDLAQLGLAVHRPIAALRDTIDVLGRIWSGETLTFKNELFDVRQFKARYRCPHRIPIYLGVRGPRLLRLAGRSAEGVILSGPLTYVKKAISIVRKEVTGRIPLRGFRIVVWLPTLVVRRRSDQELARIVAATVIADTPVRVLEMAEIPHERVKLIQETARRRGYWAASKHVTDELLNSFTISGDPNSIARAFNSIAGLGVDELVFGPPYGSSQIRSVREVVEAWARL